MSETTKITLEFPGNQVDNAERLVELRPTFAAAKDAGGDYHVKTAKSGGAKRGRKPKVVAEAAD